MMGPSLSETSSAQKALPPGADGAGLHESLKPVCGGVEKLVLGSAGVLQGLVFVISQ